MSVSSSVLASLAAFYSDGSQIFISSPELLSGSFNYADASLPTSLSSSTPFAILSPVHGSLDA